MKIVIAGPGALGCLLAASLAGTAMHELWLLDHDPHRASELAARGITLHDGETHHYPIKTSAEAEKIGPADLVLLCVKSHDVRPFLKRAAVLFTEDTLLLPFQNGILHIEALREFSAVRHRALGVTALGATLLAPGIVRCGGKGLTRIGFENVVSRQTRDQLVAAAAILNTAGLKTLVVDNILDHVWAKLIVNVGINALTAINNCPNGRLLELPRAKSQLAAAVKEAAAVAHAKGISLSEDPVAMTMAVCRKTADNLSSMLQDVRKKRPTEIDAINGAVVREALALKIPVPVNESLLQRVRALEQNYLPNFP